MKQITIKRISNMHAHIRQGEILKHLAQLFAEALYYCVCMPNTKPPKRTGFDALQYKKEILDALPADTLLHPITPLKMLWDDEFKTTPKVIEEAHELGNRWVKMYIRGVTTNSDDGIMLEDIPSLVPTFKKMAELGWIFQIHGEHPGKRIDALQREFEFHPYFVNIHERVPKLKMVFEHISDRRTIELIKQMPATVAGTLSTHFMYLTHNDVVEPGTRPKNNCKPIAKLIEDCEEIVRTAISGDPHFFWGSDIAYHPMGDKYKDKGACGCFPGQYDPLWVVKKFDEMNALDQLEGFMSLRGPQFYGIPVPEETTTFIETEEYLTDTMWRDAEIWKGGEMLNWKIA